MADESNEEQPSSVPTGNKETEIIESMFQGGEEVIGDLTVTVKNTGTKEQPTVEVKELKHFVTGGGEGGGTRGGKKRRKKRRSTKKKRKQKQKKRAK